MRVITAHVQYSSLVERAFEKIRQASRGMPAVMIRQLDALAKVMEYTTTEPQIEVLVEQARRIQAATEETIPEPADRADVTRRYDAELVAVSIAYTPAHAETTAGRNETADAAHQYLIQTFEEVIDLAHRAGVEVTHEIIDLVAALDQRRPQR